MLIIYSYIYICVGCRTPSLTLGDSPPNAPAGGGWRPPDPPLKLRCSMTRNCGTSLIESYWFAKMFKKRCQNISGDAKRCTNVEQTRCKTPPGGQTTAKQ